MDETPGRRNAESAPNREVMTPVEGSGLASWFLLLLLILSLYLLGMLVWPFLHTVIMACIVAAITHPLYAKFLIWTRGRKILSSILVLTLLVFLVVIPLSLFLTALVPQAAASISALTQWLSGAHLDDMIGRYITPLLDWVHEQIPSLSFAPEDIRIKLFAYASTTGQMLVAWGTNFLSDTLVFVSNFVLMLMILFFLLKDGTTMLRAVKRLLPMREERKDAIFMGLQRMSRAVLVGGLATAALQGVVGGIGLAIVGIPAMFWGTVMAFAALVPVVGTGLVWVPATLYLLLVGDWGHAIFLGLWCGLGVTSIDSFLRPVLMRGKSNVSILFLFMSVFGGIKAFGMLGLIYGPLILSFALVMLSLYADEYAEALGVYPKHSTPDGSGKKNAKKRGKNDRSN